MNSHPTTRAGGDERAHTLDTLALLAADVHDIDTAATLIGQPPEQILEVLQSAEGLRAVAVHLEHMRESGRLLKAKALAPLEKLVSRVHEQIEAGEVSASTAPKLLDTLLKLTGLAEERAARLRAQAEEERPKLSVHILHPGDADPAPAKAGQHVLIIDLRCKDQPPVLDVTPDDEGGDDAE